MDLVLVRRTESVDDRFWLYLGMTHASTAFVRPRRRSLVAPNSSVRTALAPRLLPPLIKRPKTGFVSMGVQAAILDNLLGDCANLRSLQHFLHPKRIQGILQLTKTSISVTRCSSRCTVPKAIVQSSRVSNSVRTFICNRHVATGVLEPITTKPELRYERCVTDQPL